MSGYGESPVPPGARPGAAAWAPPAAAEGPPPAPHGRRLVAALLDALAVAVLAVPIFVVLLSAGASADPSGGVVGLLVSALVASAVYAVAALLYAPVVMALTDGRTLGKLATGLRVVRERDGVPPRFGGALVREALVKGLVLGVATAATGGLALLADAVWALVDDRHRALHDLVAGTRVIRG